MAASAHEPLDVDVVVLTALPIEHEAVVRALGSCSTHVWRGRRLRVGHVEQFRVLAYPINGVGNVNSALAADRAIDLCKPTYILLVGIAGGARDCGRSIHHGDVLFPDQAVGYELGKIRPGAVEYRPEFYRPDFELFAAARELTAADWALVVTTPRPDGQDGRIVPQAHPGPMLSGEKVLADDTTINELRRAWPTAVGVDMESAGVASAAYHRGVGCLVAKAVTDFAGVSKDDTWHRYAADSAVRFAFAVLGNAPRNMQRS